jgi:signal transduction histidine kinase
VDVSAASHVPTSLPHHRVPPRIRTVLAWSAAVVSPPVLFAAALVGTHDGGPPALRYALPVLAVALSAGLLRRAPLPALALMLACLFAVATSVRPGDPDSLWDLRHLLVLAVDVVVGFIAADRDRRVSITAALLAFAAQCLVQGLYPVDQDFVERSLLPVASTVLTAWVIGHSVRQRRAYGAALRAHAVAQAVTAERLRLARELHDMVAHSIGVITIQAGVGSRVIDTQPAEARKAMSAIEATGRETLIGLQGILGVLRRAPADGAARGPAPGLADLDRLAADTMGAGLRVDVHWRGRRRPLPAEVDLSAFRIVQEAITNVVRHAGAQHCRVTVDYRDAELYLEVADSGNGGAVSGDGYGLIGMRERVELLHGRFAAGPRAAGGFEVAARLPIPAGVR